MTDGRRITAIVACVDASGRVLLVKQIAGPYAGAWLLPGGGVDDGESIEEGLRREMREETGLELTDVERVASYLVDERTQDFKALVHLFRAKADGDPQAEHGSAVRWALATDSGFHPALRRELADAGLRVDDVNCLRTYQRGQRGQAQINFGMRLGLDADVHAHVPYSGLFQNTDRISSGGNNNDPVSGAAQFMISEARRTLPSSTAM